MATDAQGNVGHPDDDRRNGYIAGSGKSFAGSGWNKVLGFFDGVRGITDRVAGISGDFYDIRENMTMAERLKFELQNDRDNAATDRQLSILQSERGDNVQLYWAAGAVGLGLVALTVMR